MVNKIISLGRQKWRLYLSLLLITILSALHKKKIKKHEIHYILLWKPLGESLNYYGRADKTFKKNKCPFHNCYVTDNINYFEGSLESFAAILFDGREPATKYFFEIPSERYPHQKYVYVNSEAADNYPLCTGMMKNFFNWTITYRLDSHIVTPYVTITNKEGEIVAPRRNVHWVTDMRELNQSFDKVLNSKTKAAAWFVSNCKFSRSGRLHLAQALIEAFDKYDLKIDVFGKCGTLDCPKSNRSYCLNMLKRDYYFYFAFENAINEDYVTEKVITALQNNVVPIVLGGANYSRFLPPQSYIEARSHSPEELAAIVNHLMKTPDDYRQFFKWKSYYDINDIYPRPYFKTQVCELCEALNDENRFKKYSNFIDIRKWWLPTFSKRCKQQQRQKELERVQVLEMARKVEKDRNPAVKGVRILTEY